MKVDLTAAIAASHRAIKKVFAQKVHRHIVEWADKEFWLPPESSNNKQKIRWRTYGFQRLILHAMADLDTYKTVIKKPVQVGITKCALIILGYESAHRNRSNGIWLPSRGDANKFSNVELNAMLKHVQEVKDALVVDHDKKDKDNTTRRRAFQGAQSYCTGTQTLQDVSSIPIEHAIGDEVSKYPQVLKGGKDDKGKTPVDGIAGRLDSANDPCLSLLSSCTEAGSCQISKEFDSCREKFHRGYFCPECGMWQAFVWGGEKSYGGFKFDRINDEYGERDNLLTAATVRYKCENESEGCEHEFFYEDLDDLDDFHGEWRSERLRFDEQEFKYYDLKTGEEAPPPYSVGIQVRGWHNRRKPWSKGCMEYLDAVYAVRSGDTGKMVDWVQDYVAEAYESEEKTQYIQHGYLMSRQESAPVLPDGMFSDEIQAVTKFWDVQGDRIECLTCGWAIGNECWLMDHDVYWGKPDDGNLLKHVQRHTKKVYETQSGRELPVLLTGIDAKYLPMVVNQACQGEWKFKIIPTMGSKSLGKPIVQGRTSASKDYGTFLTTLCPDTAKTQVYSMYGIEAPGPGHIHIPDLPCFNEAFIKQLVSEQRKVVNGVYRWVCPHGVRNEGLDMICGNLAMTIIAKQRYGFRFVDKALFAQQVATGMVGSDEELFGDDALNKLKSAHNA